MASLQTSNTITQFPPGGPNRLKQTIVTKTYTRSSKPKEGLGLYASEGEIPIEYENACRLCLDETEMMVNIFSDCGNLSITDKIRSLLELDVSEDDELPSLVCSICLHQLDEAYDFKKQCVATDNKLRQFLIKEPQTSLEPSSSSLIDQINDCSPVLTKQECTLEWDDYSPLAIMYKSEPLSLKNSTYDCTCTYSPYRQQKDTNVKSSDAPTVTKLTAVPVNNLANGIDEAESDFEIDSEDEDVDDPLPILYESINGQYDRESMSSSPTKSACTAEEDPLYNEYENEPDLTLRDSKRTQFLKAFTAKTIYAQGPRGRKAKSRSTQPPRVEVTNNVEVIQLDIDDVPLKDRLTLEVGTRGMNRCHRCNKLMVISLKEHIPDCLLAPRCSVCNKAFYTISMLKRHIRIHTGEKPFQCTHCDKAFTQKETLQRHFLTQHGTKTFMCPLCDKGYASQHLLSTHITNVHERKNKGITFKCNRCDKRFHHSSGLSRHQNFHNGTLFHCKICKRPFTDQSAITRHFKRVHVVK